MSVNKVILVGNLGNDPEIRQFDNGGMIANLSIATSEKWRDRNTGEPREHTEWHRVVLNNRLAEIAQQFLRKGSQVYIEGSIRTRKYTDAQGIERYSTEVRGDSLQMLGSRNNNQDSGTWQGSQANGNNWQGGNQGGNNWQGNNRSGNQPNNNRNQFTQNPNPGFNQDHGNNQSYNQDYSANNQGNGGMNAMGNQGNNSFQNPAPAAKPAPKAQAPQANQNAITPAPAVSDDDMPF